MEDYFQKYLKQMQEANNFFNIYRGLPTTNTRNSIQDAYRGPRAYRNTAYSQGPKKTSIEEALGRNNPFRSRLERFRF